MLRTSRLATLAVLACCLPACTIPLSSEELVRTEVIVLTDASAPSWVSFERPTFQEKAGAVTNPIIDSFTPAITDVKPGQPVAFTVVAKHPKNLALQFNWAATGGTLSSTTGRVVNWTPPSKAGTYTVTVVVSDAEGGVVTGNLNMTLTQDLPGNPDGPKPSPSVAASATPSAAPSALPSPAPSASATPSAAPSALPSPAPSASPSALPSQDPKLAAVEGRVTGAQNQPLVGATLTLVKASDEAQAFAARSTTSDAAGQFRFANLPVGLKLQVVAQAAGHREASLSLAATTSGQSLRADFAASSALQSF